MGLTPQMHIQHVYIYLSLLFISLTLSLSLGLCAMATRMYKYNFVKLENYALCVSAALVACMRWRLVARPEYMHMLWCAV